jgi:hypothetical protein
MKIKEIVIFAYPSRGAALEIANSAIGEDLAVCEVRMLSSVAAQIGRPAKGRAPAIAGRGLFAEQPLAWVIIPESALAGWAPVSSSAESLEIMDVVPRPKDPSHSAEDETGPDSV